MFSRWKQKHSVEYGSLEQPTLVVSQSNSHIDKNAYKNKMHYLKYMKLRPITVRAIIHIMLFFDNSTTYLGSCTLVCCTWNMSVSQ